MCADFELVTPRVPLEDFVPARLWLPYGYWTLATGPKLSSPEIICRCGESPANR
jgi:hypothetical protein